MRAGYIINRAAAAAESEGATLRTFQYSTHWIDFSVRGPNELTLLVFSVVNLLLLYVYVYY